MPIPTTIHRRLDEAFATRNFGTGTSAAGGAGTGKPALIVTAGGSGVLRGSGNGHGAGSSTAADKVAGSEAGSGRKPRGGRSFDGGAAGAPEGICRTGRASNSSSR